MPLTLSLDKDANGNAVIVWQVGGVEKREYVTSFRSLLQRIKQIVCELWGMSEK